MSSISEVGLINPISVFAERANDGILVNNGYQLVAGLNRLEACKRLGWKTIPAVMLALDDLHCQLAEVDENLCGSKLTPADRALFTRRRKDIYLALHPETRNGGDRGNQHTGGVQRQNDNLSFCQNTAAQTGVDRRTIERDTARGEALGDAVLTDVRAHPSPHFHTT